MEDVAQTQSAFQTLKGITVPLLGNSLLTPSSTPIAIDLLCKLHQTLEKLRDSGHVFAPATISYVFFPLSSILRRNDLASIPDRLMEKLLAVLAFLCNIWWWDMEATVWEQVFILCSSILGGMDRKGKGKDRDDETKAAAISCLWTLLRERTPEEDPLRHTYEGRAAEKLDTFKQHAQSDKFIPIMGQTLSSLMITAEHTNISLQRLSLKTLLPIVRDFLPVGFIPSILPGTVSSMSKVALGQRSSKGWSNGDVVAAALLVMQHAIINAVGDEICIQERVVREFEHLEDLVGRANSPTRPANNVTPSTFSTLRTEAWLRGTSSQLHIALTGLSPLAKHQTPSALIGLSAFSAGILAGTALTLPQSQSLLLSFLLSLRTCGFERVSSHATKSLQHILSSRSRNQILQVLLHMSRDYLTALPRLLLAQEDSKIEHVAGILTSICSLGCSPNQHPSSAMSAISVGVGKLLGPRGGVEKWGWSLLSSLEFTNPPAVLPQTSAPQISSTEYDSSTSHAALFPELTLRHADSSSARDALAQMLRTLGSTAGEACLFSVEWFVDVGRSGRGKRSVAALWCACRLLEGAGNVSLGTVPTSNALLARSRRLEKFARDIAKRVAEDWDDWDEDDGDVTPIASSSEEVQPVERIQGLVSIVAIPGSEPSTSSTPSYVTLQPALHRCLSLQLLSIAAGILESRFSSLFIQAVYPVLHGIVSSTPIMSASALAALTFIANCTSYATPSNLLLSNFDYALDSVSRHLTRRWLDVDATKVLALLVRLVGRDVVQKAGDVVEECFDRLDEYHGYELIVDGLVEVLGEVVKAIQEDDSNIVLRKPGALSQATTSDSGADSVDTFMEWFTHRHDEQPTESMEHTLPQEEDQHGETGQASSNANVDPFTEAPPTPGQTLTKHIVSRSTYFLTHASPTIRAHILLLLARAVPILPEPALLPSVHHAWPYILNRLGDTETFVVSAATTLLEALATSVGDFMAGRIWEDVWPRFRIMLEQLDRADASSALARTRSAGPGVGTESAYTHSHRLYRAIIGTMTAAVRDVQAQDVGCWEVIVLFRRFLRREVHEELQAKTRALYSTLCENNEDAVWLGLSATLGRIKGPMCFLYEPDWHTESNVEAVLQRRER